MQPKGQKFYFSTTRKVTAAFGSLFTDILLSRYDSNGNITNLIRVPFQYSSTTKWMAANQQRDLDNPVRLRMMLPRMSFELKDIKYDSKRQLPAVNYAQTSKSSLTTPEMIRYFQMMTPVPYDFEYVLHIGTKNIDDMLQIVEQIVPYFAPSFTVRIYELPQFNVERDVPIILTGIAMEDSFAGPLEDRRFIKYDLTFTAKAYYLKPIEDQAIIKQIKMSLYTDATFTAKISELDTDAVLDSNGNPVYDSNGDFLYTQTEMDFVPPEIV